MSRISDQGHGLQLHCMPVAMERRLLIRCRVAHVRCHMHDFLHQLNLSLLVIGEDLSRISTIPNEASTLGF